MDEDGYFDLDEAKLPVSRKTSYVTLAHQLDCIQIRRKLLCSIFSAKVE